MIYFFTRHAQSEINKATKDIVEHYKVDNTYLALRHRPQWVYGVKYSMNFVDCQSLNMENYNALKQRKKHNKLNLMLFQYLLLKEFQKLVILSLAIETFQFSSNLFQLKPLDHVVILLQKINLNYQDILNLILMASQKKVNIGTSNMIIKIIYKGHKKQEL